MIAITILSTPELLVMMLSILHIEIKKTQNLGVFATTRWQVCMCNEHYIYSRVAIFIRKNCEVSLADLEQSALPLHLCFLLPSPSLLTPSGHPLPPALRVSSSPTAATPTTVGLGERRVWRSRTVGTHRPSTDPGETTPVNTHPLQPYYNRLSNGVCTRCGMKSPMTYTFHFKTTQIFRAF